MTQTTSPNPDNESPGFLSGLISHLIELRSRLLKVLLVFTLVFLGLLPFANDLYTWAATPLLNRLPAGSKMIAVDVTSPFMIPFKLVMLISIFIIVPYALYHVWAFVAPGLYKRERRIVLPLLASSVILFYVGTAFAYFFVFPVIFDFVVSTAPQGVSVMTDIERYLDFVTAMFLAFGVAFEVPVAAVLLVAIGLITPAKLVAARPYVIVGAFIVGMLLTPPDVISQVMLAVPMCLLYEVGILAAKLLVKYRKTESGGSVAAVEKPE